MEPVWTIISRKFDGSLHRRWTRAHPLQPSPQYKGDEIPQFSLLIPAFTPVQEGDGHSWTSSYDVVACFYALRHYQVMMLKKVAGTEYYCNSCSMAEIDEVAHEVRFIDLDLDLLVDHSGLMRLVDDDEFAVNRVRYGYSEDLCQRVERDLEHLMGQVRHRRGVFSAQYSARASRAYRGPER